MLVIKSYEQCLKLSNVRLFFFCNIRKDRFNVLILSQGSHLFVKINRIILCNYACS